MRRVWVLAVLPLLVVLGSCGDGDDDGGRPDEVPTPPPVTDGFRLTRPDGSTTEVSGPFAVECLDDGTVVRVTNEYDPDGSSDRARGLVAVGVTEEGHTFDLPLESSRSGDEVVSFYDGPNELSADTDASRGTVRVVAATCDPVPHLVVEVVGTIGSKNPTQDPVEVTGGLDVTGG
jgi:hypothetical protein